MFYFQFDTFSSNSDEGLTRQQLKKFLSSQKGKFTLGSKNYVNDMQLRSLLLLVSLFLLIMIDSYMLKIIEAGNNEPFWVTRG